MTDERHPTPGSAADGSSPASQSASAPARQSASAAASAPADRPVPRDPGDASLLELIDRLTVLLERSELTELEIETGGTALTLRKPAALAAAPPLAAAPAPEPGSDGPSPAPQAPAAARPREAAPSRPSVKAPLTGIWYASPSPGSAPYVDVGSEVVAGQVVGLIEAMKLFNEIKSDISGRVVRVVAESGKLVKARQPLIEVEPL